MNTRHPCVMYKHYGINQPAVTGSGTSSTSGIPLDETSKKRTRTTAPAEVNSMPTVRQQCPLRSPFSCAEEEKKPPSHREINIKLAKIEIVETVNGTAQPSPAQTPRILRASWISFCIIVTRFACSAQRFVSSNRWTRKASAASCRAWIACDCQRNSAPTSAGRRSSATSRTKRAKGSFAMRRS